MTAIRKQTPAHAIGIDLGTTYSCISYLTPQGTPVTIENEDGELSTPSVVLFDGDQAIVGTEALRNAVTHPERVVQNSKRFMGDRQKCWIIDGVMHRPPDVASLIIRKLLENAEERLGRIRHAVITVPAQFSDLQRQDTVEAGMRAGLARVDIINEPVAASLCYVLGEGMWFAELAKDQLVLVFDLGGGTFDLSLVQYNRSEVKVVASGGDLQLGGIDWNKRLEQFACEEFIKETPADPRLDKESMQSLALEVEQTKRSLSVRPKASIAVQHAGRRKSISVTRERFEGLSRGLVERCEQITKKLLIDRKLGWAHVNSVLVTGGATRMPMIRDMLQRISGTTLNATLSPDQSISHGAAYYAGMLLSGKRFASTYLHKSATAKLSKFRQVSVNARALGILVRDPETGQRVPHYLLPPHTPLPVRVKQRFGTVIPNQRRVHLQIVESGITPEQPYARLGACVIEQLPENLPVSSPIEVTLRYDEQARVHVEARDETSGRMAMAVIVREENRTYLTPEQAHAAEVALQPEGGPLASGTDPVPAPDVPVVTVIPRKDDAKPQATLLSRSPKAAVAKPDAKNVEAAKPETKKLEATKAAAKPPSPEVAEMLERAQRPILLCNYCGEPLGAKGKCTGCGRTAPPAKPRKAPRPPAADRDILPLSGKTPPGGLKPKGSAARSRPPQKSPDAEGADEFWNLDG
ncbi:MAG: Hsp70 family protein [Planctomycetaceae bacterium]